MDTLSELLSSSDTFGRASVHSPQIRPSDEESGPSVRIREGKLLESILSGERERPIWEIPSIEGFEGPLRVSPMVGDRNE